MHGQAGGLGQHPPGGTGGDDCVAGKDPAVCGTELKCKFLAGIVCKNGNRHSALSFILSIVLWVANDAGWLFYKYTFFPFGINLLESFSNFPLLFYRRKQGFVKRFVVILARKQAKV